MLPFYTGEIPDPHNVQHPEPGVMHLGVLNFPPEKILVHGGKPAPVEGGIFGVKIMGGKIRIQEGRLFAQELADLLQHKTILNFHKVPDYLGLYGDPHVDHLFNLMQVDKGNRGLPVGNDPDKVYRRQVPECAAYRCAGHGEALADGAFRNYRPRRNGKIKDFFL
jgi:hypothetical protein